MEQGALTTPASVTEGPGGVSAKFPDPRPGVLPTNPVLSVCMIVRDEGKVLHRCLKSVESVADELIVVDTGSKDNTISIAKAFGAKVFHFEWCDDFAAARNESLKHATGDWILQMDADEELLPDSILHVKHDMSKSTMLCYVVRCDHGPEYRGPQSSWLGRLFRNHPRVRYSRPYHETVQQCVDKLIGQEPRWRTQWEQNITIRHYGYAPSERLRKRGRGIAIMKAYLEENPDDVYILTKLGGAYYDLGRYYEAEACLQNAVKIDPKWGETHYTLGLTLQRRKKLNAAMRCYEKAIAKTPLLAEAHVCLGAIHGQKGMLDKAISEFRRALAINPGLSMAHTNMGLALGQQGKLSEAIIHLSEALRVSPDDAQTHNNLGTALAQAGRFDEAITHYREALRIKPDLKVAKENLKEALKDAGKVELSSTLPDR